MKIFSAYKCKIATLAFLDGVLVSAAINVLTNFSAYVGYKKWVALGFVAAMSICAVLMLFWQNIATKLQDIYTLWKADVENNNENCKGETPRPTNWATMMRAAVIDYKNTKETIGNIDKKYFGLEEGKVHYSASGLTAIVVLTILSFFVSVALLVIITL